jgi:biopolymer transport protein ExbB
MTQQSNFGFGHFLSQADAVGLIVLGILLVMSVASWYLILVKSTRNLQTRRKSREFLGRFWSAASLEQVASDLTRNPALEPFGRLAAQGLAAQAHWDKSSAASIAKGAGHDEFITRAIRRAMTQETAHSESGLTVLASVGSSAPFVGLFGTVWGIYHALLAIGFSGKASLDAVAGPVGEALIMTALGLAVAIPAVLAYNAFVRSNRLLLTELDGFAHDVQAFLVTGSKVAGGARGRAMAGASAPRPATTGAA